MSFRAFVRSISFRDRTWWLSVTQFRAPIPKRRPMLEQNIPHISFPQALGQFLIGTRSSVVVAGTHGKTTTTALAAWVFTRAGLDPGFFVGGVPLNFGSGWKVGAGNHVVIEGDEYDSAFFDKGPKFLHYRPEHVILTSIEFDHADIYRDLDHVKERFPAAHGNHSGQWNAGRMRRLSGGKRDRRGGAL